MRAAPRAVSISAVAALVLAAVWVFWPLTLGGSTTYVGTHGTSMEPRFHTGDLAILRSAPSYTVGDVVAYRSVSLDTVVMHRIVAMDGARFVIQGDNNDWLDEDHPSEDQVLGKLFLRVPKGGMVLGALRSPVGIVVLGLATSALGALARRPGGRHGRRSRRRPGRPAAALSPSARGQARQVALGAGAVALVAAIGGGVLLAMPSTRNESTTLHVTQQGQFSYSGTAEAGTTYPDGRITTGDTVWTKLAEDLTVSFTNTVSGPHLAALRGAMRLDVTISSTDGWSSYLNSSPVVALANGSATAAAPIDTPRASRLLAKHYAETGAPSGSATLTVTPVVVTTGTASGKKFQAGSPAPLAFTVDPTSLRLAGKPDTELAPSTTTDVVVGQTAPRRFTVLGQTIPIGLARFVAAVAFALALPVLAGAAWVGRTARGDAADEFVVKHAARILPVASFDPGPTVIDVSDAAALHRVAERFDTLVLHHAGQDADVFAVRDVDATYRFVVPGGREARSKPPVPAPRPVPQPPPVEIDDGTAPLPLIVAKPQSSVSAGLWGKFA
jgi:signal peptidase I